MLKYCVMLTLCVNYGYSQSEIVEPKKNLVTENNALVYPRPIIIEQTPSLEEQGFKAITLENNKMIYRKEINGIIVEFKPEEL